MEWEFPMVNTLRNRLVKSWNHSIEDAEKRVVMFDIQKTNELLNGNWSGESKKQYAEFNHPQIVSTGLKGLIQNQKVDLIIGGPPCQAYSIAGRAQSGMKTDYRNFLFESFVKVVEEFKPNLFVFENVPGLLSACPGDIPVRIRIYEAFKNIGYEILEPEKLKNAIYCAHDFNTPQNRNRIIIIGIKKDSNLTLSDFYESLDANKKDSKLTVKDAIGNLPKFKPLDNPIKENKKNISHVLIEKSNYTQHEARYHNLRDQKVFKTWITNKMNYCSLQEQISFYNNLAGKNSKHSKYRNLEWDKPSPTVVAHLQKDGLMFIHPDVSQLRSITIREAGLLQTFPADYEFLGNTAYCYKMIGNAVPVQFAKGIAESIFDVLIKKLVTK